MAIAVDMGEVVRHECGKPLDVALHYAVTRTTCGLPNLTLGIDSARHSWRARVAEA